MNTATRQESTGASIEQRDDAPSAGPVYSLAPALPGPDVRDAKGGARTVTILRRAGSKRSRKAVLLAVVLIVLAGLVGFLGGRSVSAAAGASPDVAAAVESQNADTGPGGIMSVRARYGIPLSDKAGGW